MALHFTRTYIQDKWEDAIDASMRKACIAKELKWNWFQMVPHWSSADRLDGAIDVIRNIICRANPNISWIEVADGFEFLPKNPHRDTEHNRDNRNYSEIKNYSRLVVSKKKEWLSL